MDDKLKAKLEKAIDSDTELQADLEKLSSFEKITDFFQDEVLSGEVFRKLAVVLLAIRDEYLADTGKTTQDLIDEAVAWLDELIALPWYAEPWDGPALKWALRSVMNALEQYAEAQAEIAETQLKLAA
jgi:hypothetical protein